MKIVLNSTDDNLITEFLRLAKINDVEIIKVRTEKSLFDTIIVGDVNALLLDNSLNYCQRAADFIKKKHRYIPVIILEKDNSKIINGDIYLPIGSSLPLIIKNILGFEKNFKSLQKLTIKIKDKIFFGNCSYDPTKRTLYHKSKEISKFSEKAGGIIELLGSNYGKLIKKELILERVWSKSDYFSSRSMDVYITNIRNVFKNNNIDLEIKNFSKSGLTLQQNDNKK
jgi:DNA-binding winged helix-turn-helix (wHTH) protein